MPNCKMLWFVALLPVIRSENVGFALLFRSLLAGGASVQSDG